MNVHDGGSGKGGLRTRSVEAWCIRLLGLIAVGGPCLEADLLSRLHPDAPDDDLLERCLSLLDRAGLIEWSGNRVAITERGSDAVSRLRRIAAGRTGRRAPAPAKAGGEADRPSGRAEEPLADAPPPQGPDRADGNGEPAEAAIGTDDDGPAPARAEAGTRGREAGTPSGIEQAASPDTGERETLPKKERRWQTKRLVSLAAVGIAAVLAVWLVLQGRSEGGADYRFATVQRSDLEVTAVVTGRLDAIDTVDVSSQLSGQIVRLDADYNDDVTAGAPLAQLDDKTFSLAVDEAQARLAQARASYASAEARTAGAKARFEEAQQDDNRKNILAKKGNISTQEVDKAHANLLSAQSALDAAEADEATQKATIDVADASLRKARIELDRTTIRSPIDGVVIGRSAELGQTVAVGTDAPKLFTIAHDLREMRVNARVDEADIGQISVGQPARFSVDAYPGRIFNGHVVAIHRSPTTIQNVVTYTVVVTAGNPDLLLLPGMTALVRIVTTERHDVLLVPNAALRFQPSPSGDAAASGARAAQAGNTQSPHVWVRDASGRLSRASVKLGATDGSVTEVTAGSLAAGQTVAIGEAPPRAGGTLFGLRMGF